MSFLVEFDNLIEYDSGLSGITLEISLRLKNAEVDVSAKLDTGSTDCIFNRKIGERLGLEIEKGIEVGIGTATGSFSVFRHSVNLVVLGIEFDANVCFAENENFNRNVLGRHGFLDRMNIGLIDYEGKLFLSEYTGE